MKFVIKRVTIGTHSCARHIQMQYLSLDEGASFDRGRPLQIVPKPFELEWRKFIFRDHLPFNKAQWYRPICS